MYVHANAKLGPAGRFAMVRLIEQGASLRVAAAAFSVSPPDRVGATIGGRRYRLFALDRLEGALAGRYLAAATAVEGTGESV